MTRSAKKKKKEVIASQEMLRQPLPIRQRQRLIDACITALHLYGPTGATVARVVAIAKLSPGIVRFYFRSKAAMLVASLQFLATEFEDRVVTPVVALRGQPALALQRLVELYLDPEIASPRKVAVWYAFWGEASARQEYLAICGQKDANFAALVHDLVDRLIASSGRRHLDSEAVALGLIGVLEMLWQGFAFEEEANIDRALARRRCMAYLRSVFPREFAALDEGTGAGRVTRGMPGDPLEEREKFFRGAWQFAGHEQEIPVNGDFASLDLAETRALLVRDAAGTVRAFRNACRSLPHALVSARRGRFTDGSISCVLHGLAYGLDGRSVPARERAGLLEFEVHRFRGLIFVRSPVAARPWPEPDLAGLDDTGDCVPLPDCAGSPLPVEADWKIVMMQLLESRPPGATTGPWRRIFLWPNMLVEQRPDALSILQVLPAGAGRSRVQQFEYAAPAVDPQASASAERARSTMRARSA
ncbi:MAG: TetR family transcriptional regulator C-terminal domain-containing protein, partial [Steroidobacteraceae bacterium]